MKYIKHSLFATVLMLTPVVASAEDNNMKFINGDALTLINKTIETPERYTRIDTVKYTGFTDYQRRYLNLQSAGLALCFKTDSKNIYVRPSYINNRHGWNQTEATTDGFTLYIKKNDNWLYAGSKALSDKDYMTMVSNMAPGEKECLLYLPNFSVVEKVEIGIDADADIDAIPNPFRHKIVFFGSSFTHGTSTSRPGLSYPMQFERATGLHICDLGMSGNSKLQQSYAKVLADTEADAFVFDSFSNPSAEEIEENFDAFVATIRAAHPTTPLIFMQTIYRENRNFNTKEDAIEQAKMDMGEKVVKKAMENDKNIYWLIPNTGDSHDTSVDGVHPNDYGYMLWMESIRQPLLEIFAKYNIK